MAGCFGTSNCMAADMLNKKASGTMAHSWIESFDSELESFIAFAKTYPENCILLVDTYDTLRSGIPNAIKTFNWMKENGLPVNNIGIRIDSGDLAYLSKKARKMLDDAGLEDCKICISNSLDEKLIEELIYQGACVDTFGVGERLITSKSDPVFGCVYKLVAIDDKNGNVIPKIKVSENPSKITNPGFKKVYRIYDNITNKALADLICLHDEEIDVNNDLEN